MAVEVTLYEGDLSFASTETFLQELFLALCYQPNSFKTRTVVALWQEEVRAAADRADERQQQVKPRQHQPLPYVIFRQVSKETLLAEVNEDLVGPLRTLSAEEFAATFDAVVAFKALRGATVLLFYGAAFFCPGVDLPLNLMHLLGIPNLVKSSYVAALCLPSDEPSNEENVVDRFRQHCAAVSVGLGGDLSKAACNGKAVIFEGPYLDPNQTELYTKHLSKGTFPVALVECILSGSVRLQQTTNIREPYSEQEIRLHLAPYMRLATVKRPLVEIEVIEGEIADLELVKVHQAVLSAICEKNAAKFR